VLYIFRESSKLSPVQERENKIARTRTRVRGSGGATTGRVKEVVLDCGHLVLMGKFGECAAAITYFLGNELKDGNMSKKSFKNIGREKAERRKPRLTKNRFRR
jgi:hypothetical protein